MKRYRITIEVETDAYRPQLNQMAEQLKAECKEQLFNVKVVYLATDIVDKHVLDG